MLFFVNQHNQQSHVPSSVVMLRRFAVRAAPLIRQRKEPGTRRLMRGCGALPLGSWLRILLVIAAALMCGILFAVRAYELRRAADARALHVAYSICGPNWDGYIGLTSAISLLYSRARLGTEDRDLHIHFALDADAHGSLPRTLQYQRLVRYAAASSTVRLHWHVMSDAESGSDAFTHVFRRCSGARLRLVRELRSVPRVLYLDWDTTVHCDLAGRWDGLFGTLEAAGAGLGMAPEGVYSGANAEADGWCVRRRGHPLPCPHSSASSTSLRSPLHSTVLNSSPLRSPLPTQVHPPRPPHSYPRGLQRRHPRHPVRLLPGRGGGP